MVLTSESAIDPQWFHRPSDRIEILYSTHIESIYGVVMSVQWATLLTLVVDL
jgi:hypothetical protein